MPYIHKSGKQFGLADISIITGVQCREMTQAQYDALSTEEKNNGTVYFIIGGRQDNLYISDTVPIGAIQAYGGTTAPAGWLICNGMAVNRVVYRELFAVIGTTYGEGDTVTTFNLPNLKGRVAIGADTGYVLGSTGGEETHQLTTNELPAHKHHMSTNNDDFNNTQSGGNYGTTRDGTTAWYNTAWYTDETGGDQPHNNMQPYLVTNYIIKAKDVHQVGTSGESGGGGGSVVIDSTAIPSPNMVAEFDDNAYMNSTDMSAAEVNNFVGGLAPHNTGIPWGIDTSNIISTINIPASGSTQTYTATTICIAVVEINMQANSNGYITIGIDGVSFTAYQSGQACCFYTITPFQLVPGQTISVYVNSNKASKITVYGYHKI